MFDKNKFANIFRTILEKYNNQNEFSCNSNIGRAYISRILNMRLEKPPKPSTLQKIADASKGVTTYNELMQICGYTSNIHQSVFNDFNDFYAIPVFIAKNGKLCETNQDVVLPFKWDGVHQYFAYLAQDDAMFPLLDVNDMAIICKQSIIENKATHLIKIDDNITIRKITLNEDKTYYTLTAMNPCYKVVNIPKNEIYNQIEILGKVVKAENQSAFK